MKQKLLLLLLAMLFTLSGRAAVGDEFAVTFGKITITFAVVSEEAGNKTCKVFKNQGEGEFYSAQVFNIDEGWDGVLSIPDVVDKSESDKGYKVIEISNGAFLGCTSIKSLVIGNNVLTIGVHSFSGCENLESLTIGDKVKTIDDSAFRSCKLLSSIRIPASVESVGKYAFCNCGNLLSIYIENGNTEWGLYALDDCDALSSIKIEYHSPTCKELSGLYSKGDLIKEIVIGDEVSTIDEKAFYRFGITEVNIPNNVTTIGEFAFSECNGLKSVIIPANVANVGSGAFSRCSSLTSVTVNCKNVGDWFASSDNIEELVLGEGVETIAENVFRNDTKLSTVVLPSTLTGVGDCAFAGCTNLTEVQMNCKEIGDWFSGLTGLKTVVIGDQTENILDQAFLECTALESVTLGKSVISIGQSAFAECEKLTTINIPQNLKEIGDYAFFKSGITSFVIPASIETVGVGAFFKCSELASVELHCAVIVDWFSGQKNLKEIIFGDEVTSIGDFAFPSASIEELIIGKNVTKIGESAFGKCTSLTSVVIPQSVEEIADDAFHGCSNLQEVKVLSKTPITAVSESAFSGSNYESQCVLRVPKGTTSEYKQASVWKDFKYIEEEKDDETEPITIGKSGKASYCGDQSLDFSFSDEVKAYIATGFDKDEGTIWLTRVKDVPAGVPVLIKGEANKTYDVPVTDSQNSYYTNMFVGNTSGDKIQISETDGNLVNYYLAGDGTFKSVKGYANIGNNKSYLQLPGTFNPTVVGGNQTVKIGSVGKASYAAPVDLDFTNVTGLKAFTATGYDKSSKTIWLTRVMKVQKGEGVLLKGNPQDYEIPSAAVQSSYMNMFIGNTSGDQIQVLEKSDDGSLTNYYLKGDGTFVSVNGYVNINNNKCYLALPTSMVSTAASTRGEANYLLEESEVITMPVLFRSLDNDGDGTTAIRETKQAKEDGAYYTLQGQRVENPNKGVYIRNGKKVVIK